MTDKEHAAAIARAVSVLNSATYAATKAGLALDMDVIETSASRLWPAEALLTFNRRCANLVR